MGKGDQRTKRGKIFRGTFGNTRRRKKKKTAQEAREKQDAGMVVHRPTPAA
jgi:ribosomal small subunit protein bTHX